MQIHGPSFVLGDDNLHFNDDGYSRRWYHTFNLYMIKFWLLLRVPFFLY